MDFSVHSSVIKCSREGGEFRTWGPFIDGEFVEAEGSAVIDVYDPANGNVLGQVHEAGRADVDRAVDSSRLAFEGSWSRCPAAERGRLLWKLADLIEGDTDDLAAIETANNGKPIAYARRDDLSLTVAAFRYFAGFADKGFGETVPPATPSRFVYTIHEPIGVCAGIIPWNYPLMMAAWKLAPALACGNTVILKPAEQTPLTALRLAELIREAGFPPGVVNVLNGSGEVTGAQLVSHPGVDKVAFTGGTEAGRAVLAASIPGLKRVSLELGGKSPNIIFSDANEQARREGALWGIFYNMGQDCTAGSRLLVQREIFDQVLDQLVSDAEELVIGPGHDPMTQVGPLITPEHQQRVLSYIDEAAESGTVLTGGRVSGGIDPRGNWVKPTVIARCSPDSRAAREEIFGPVVVVLPFSDEADAVRLANDSEYGLAAGLWTQDLSRAHRVAGALRAGTVWVNCYGEIDSGAPFGGFKASGHGRELGSYALDLYTEVKSVAMVVS